MVDIWYGEFSVGSVEKGSGIFAGSNRHWKRKHVSKHNQAFGTVDGDGTLATDLAARLSDRDGIDTDSSGSPRKP